MCRHWPSWHSNNAEADTFYGLVAPGGTRTILFKRSMRRSEGMQSPEIQIFVPKLERRRAQFSRRVCHLHRRATSEVVGGWKGRGS